MNYIKTLNKFKITSMKSISILFLIVASLGSQAFADIRAERALRGFGATCNVDVRSLQVTGKDWILVPEYVLETLFNAGKTAYDSTATKQYERTFVVNFNHANENWNASGKFVEFQSPNNASSDFWYKVSEVKNTRTGLLEPIEGLESLCKNTFRQSEFIGLWSLRIK